jgi:hypothetical protein
MNAETDAEAIFDEPASVLAARLHNNRRAESTTPADERGRCPECGSPDLQPTNNTPMGAEPAAQWRCRGCCTPVDEPDHGGDD